MILQELLLTLSEWLGAVAVTMLAGISARFKRRPLVFQYPRREGIVSLVLYVVILILAFLLYTGTVSLHLPVNISLPEGLLQRVICAVLGLILFGAALYIRRQPLLSTGWGKQMLRPALELGLALAFLTFFLHGKVFTLMRGINSSQVNALIACLVLSAAEETIFRGYIQLRLSAFFGERLGWISTALLFAVWNLPRLLLAPETLAIKWVLVTIQGLVLGWIAQKSGHVLAPLLYRCISEWVIFLI